jgi:tripartite-type tricarboxylate transporter receptor subunit TctC
VPKERLEALRKAFDATMADKEFLAEADKIGLEITPVNGQKIQDLVNQVYKDTTPEIAKKIAAMLK